MNDPLQRHYRELFHTHGDTARAVQYSDAPSQERRFRVLSQVASELGSVVDLGCGLGHFGDFLRTNGFQGRYLGLDFVPEFIEHASRKHAQETNTEFRRFDLMRDEFPQDYDTFAVCGVFNNRMPDNRQFMEATVVKAFAAARRHVAFNAMSTYVDFEDPALFYTDPREVFDFCKRLTRRVTLRHDYLVRDDRPPFEYTIYLYK